jgi:CBS domain-containing protein/anti-sigma regulatory factor (Ser/Thr protein kinase)
MSKPEPTVTDTAEITRAQELVYELRVKEVMKTEVITVSPGSTMRELMAVLRVNRISGTPVVENGNLIGIISIEDLIKAFARQRFDDLVSDHMTRRVIAVGADEHAVQAVKLFAQYGFGRLPVTDKEGKLVGIITGSDITRGLLSTLNKQYQSEEIRRYRASHIFEDTLSDSTSLILRYHIAPRDFEQGGQASSTLKRTLQRLGVNPALLRRINVSAYEAEMNLIIHTTNGGEIRVEISPQRIVLVTEDTGPGIADVEQAFKPGYSTAADWVRELGFGAGMGLCNIKRYSDSVSMTSVPGKGSILSAVFEVGPADHPE